MPESQQLRMAVAQNTVCKDPRDITALRDSAGDIRRLMREAHAAGARLIHFPEGATCSPHKRILSIDGPDKVGPSDWDRFEWDVLQEELSTTAALAKELHLWTVLGAVHRLSPPHRPHNSLYVISDQGKVVTRYDERMLSNTKVSFMYTPGSKPVTFAVDGVTFGCSLGMEVHFPEVFSEYERLNVDCVLFSSTGSPAEKDVFATEAQGLAAINSYWISYSVTAQYAGAHAPSGVISPEGEWLARCSQDGGPSLAVVDLHIAENRARPWRRTARGGIYDRHVIHDDPRSDNRASF